MKRADAPDTREIMSVQQPAVGGPGRRHRLAGAIYGQIVATATILALAYDDLGALALLATVLSTMLVFWIAHAYAQILAGQAEWEGRLGWRQVLVYLRQEWPIVQAALPATTALGLAALGLWSRDTGVVLAVILGVGSLFGWGMAIARRAGKPWLTSIGASVISGGLGLVIVALELLLH